MLFDLNGNTYVIDEKKEFELSINRVYSVIESEFLTDSDKINLLNMILSAIKIDIQTSIILDIISYEKNENKIPSFIPDYYLNNYKEKVPIKISGIKKELYLSKDIIISCPWEFDRFKNSLKNLSKNTFKYNKNSHDVIYYEGLDIAVVFGGNHSIGMGIIKRDGKVLADVIDVYSIFKYVDIDEDLNFFDIKTNKAIKTNVDLRIALLYKISKIKSELNITKESMQNVDEFYSNIHDNIFTITKHTSYNSSEINITLKVFDDFNYNKDNPISSISLRLVQKHCIIYIDNIQFSKIPYICNDIANKLLDYTKEIAISNNIKAIYGKFKVNEYNFINDIIGFYEQNDYVVRKLNEDEYEFLKTLVFKI